MHTFLRQLKQYFHIPVLILGILVTALWSVILYDQTAAIRQHQLEQLGHLQMDKVQRSVNKYIHISERMAEYVVRHKGNAEGIDNWALPFFSMNRSLRSVQMAPDGVVTYVYPKGVNRFYLGDLSKGPYAYQADYARRKHTPDVESLFPMYIGGTGMLFMYPVYIFDDFGGERFWGYSIVTVAQDDFIDEMNLASLEALGINYELSWDGIGHDKEQKIFDHGYLGQETVAVKKTVQDDTWTIRLCYANNWENRGMIFFAIWGGLLSSAIVSFLWQRNRKLKEMSSIDSLTGAYNRKGGDEEVARYLKKEKPEHFMVMALDIDNFKFLNDVYGHDAGDQALKKMVADIHQNFGEPLILTRNGGDEFVIMKPYEDENGMLEKIRHFTVTPHRLPYRDKIIDFYTSLGCASYPAQDQEYKKLCIKADFALYNAKINGKAGWRKYDDSVLHLQERVQLGFKLSDITDNIPGSILVYRADPAARILFATDTMIHMAGCSSWDEFITYSQGSYRNIVLPEDWDYLISERKKMRAGMEDEKKIVFISYRIRTKSGALKRVFAAGHYSMNKFHGGIFYVSLFDKEMLAIKRQESHRDSDEAEK